MKYVYTIEVIPGAPSSRRIETCEAQDLDEAWDKARSHARRLASIARVDTLRQMPQGLR